MKRMTQAMQMPVHASRPLEPEIVGYQALLQVLEIESAALCRLDPEAVLDAAAAKQQHVLDLEELARVREDALAKAGLPSSESGIEAWLKMRASDLPSLEDWSELKALAGAACAANARNGRLLARQRQHFDRSHAALLRAAGVPADYGSDGRPRGAGLSRLRIAG